MLRVGIDVGGTFTDLVAHDASSGATHVLKVASTPRAPERGVIAAIDALFARYAQPPPIEYVAHSTTIATNALLGQMHLELPRVVFVTTAGFRDVIEIGRQNRSDVYNLFVTRPRPLVAREDRVTVDERIDYHGNVLHALTTAEIDRVVGEVAHRKPDAVAIGFLHSYANDAHERAIADALTRAIPELRVTRSSHIDPEYREYERFSTAVVNAALMPIVEGYLVRLQALLHDRKIDAPLYVLQSNGGMSDLAHVASRPATIIESGPASGVIAAAATGSTAGLRHVLSFDMGGTTAKAGTIANGIVQVANEFEAAGGTHSGRSVKGSGYPVRFPFVDLAEVSAGGGTIAWLDDAGALRVGPISAGADPGPACYGTSDRATVTDANVVLGRLNQTHLAGGTFPIDAARSHAAIETLARQLKLSTHETAAGIIALVDAEMAKALRIVTVERGLDPRDFALMAFGGNGPLHACALADELGVTRIVIPAHPGVFSAEGLIVADLRTSAVHPVLRTVDELDASDLDVVFDQLERDGRATLRKQGIAEDAIEIVRTYDARYRGQSFELDIAYAPTLDALARAFHEHHARRYGYSVPDDAIEIVNARIDAIGRLPAHHRRHRPSPERASESGRRAVWIDRARVPVTVHAREALDERTVLTGPALVEQYDTCTYVAPGWRASVRDGLLDLERLA